ncbi:hypothetical protein XM38_023630 [Halomicronema hongdechloris C2206]|uniref:Uncharacterized protein n=1 Tax=Halomicronema hongdechloris C2206 TaxID=1641165 RepID=A0A1Z3HM71_9CYAN|nr:hypothetical protein [Halomicronema hongdechloris]ASC71411.1 hypothetical protein XM38_023630 [Halomicronema hongdechloris C2206]
MTDSQNVQEHLEIMTEEGAAPPNQELVFDPTTGQLVVKSISDPKPNPDAVTATQIAEDGFFQE